MPANRVPSATKKLKGTDQPCRMNQDEPEPPRGNTHCPAHLDKIAKREWRRLELILSAMKVLTDADWATLAIMAQQLSVWEQVSREVLADGLLTGRLHNQRLTAMTESGEPIVINMVEVTRHPGIKVMNDAIAIIQKCSSELGLTPASRTKVKTVDSKENKNPWSGIEQPQQQRDTQSQVQ